MLEKLRKKARNLYEFTKDDNILTIINMLECDDCFFKMDIDVAINVLMDLGFTKEESKKLYINLINKENVEE